jgi:hypothetical protein
MFLAMAALITLPTTHNHHDGPVAAEDPHIHRPIFRSPANLPVRFDPA